MKKILYKIDFYNFWHAGSGLSGATYADSLVNKDKNNLPFIPGKTLKGLIRDAAEQINKLDDNISSSAYLKKVFGVNPEELKGEENSFENEGCAFFTDATLSKYLSDNILTNGLTQELYQVISSTQIDENGQAKDNSLRQMEVTVPLTLYGIIENFPEEYTDELKTSLDWIKRLGQNRNRGLGRCQFSLLKD